MKKKIIIAGAILVVLAGGFGIKHAVTTYKATHASSNHEYYYKNTSKQDAQPTGTGDPALTNSDLPSRDEVVTTPESIFCLVNKEYSLPSDYVPEDLVKPNVSFSINYESEKQLLRKAAAEALEELFQDANEQNLELTAVSGYRSYERQKEIYENNLKTRGTSHTNQYSAKPGYSEHQTGLVMDVSCKSENYDLQESFGDTPEGIWLAENAHLYGYIIRYPEDKCEITGYAYEPWHIRYVGVPLATYLYDNKMTLDEYYHYEPSYNYITDESEYINDTPNENVGNSTPVYSSSPSSNPVTNGNGANTNTTNNNDNTAKASKAPVVSKAPAVASPSVKPSAQASAAPQKTPAPSVKPSVKPSKAPSAAPSESVPSPAPSAAHPSKAPQEPDDNNDNDDNTGSNGSAESVE